MIAAQLEDHALTILLGVDAHDRDDRHKDAHRNPAKTAIELQPLVCHEQPLYGNGRNIQDDLTVLDKVLGDLNTGFMRVDENVGGAIVVQYPFVQGPDEVGPV